jgi:hypothetical protein
LRKIVFISIFIFLSNLTVGQNFYLKIESNSKGEKKTIDSIQYKAIHLNTKSLIDEYNLFSEKLLILGYIDFKNNGYIKPNDSTFLFNCTLGRKINHLYITVKNAIFYDLLDETKKDTIKIRFEEHNDFIRNISTKLEAKGFSMSKSQLKSIRKANGILYCELFIEKSNKRTLDNIIINGYDKFPKSHKSNLVRLFKNKTFNQSNLEKLYTNINKYNFVNQIKYPEILFKKDSTITYIYLERAKSNTFDGVIGFTNDDQNKITFNGYLDLQLDNILNSGEQFTLFWKSNGKEQKTFNASFEIPYVFNTPVGIKTELQILKQDSTFQNTRTSVNFGYYFNYNSRLYAGYETTESSDIQNTNSINISDYKNRFYTTSFDYSIIDRIDILFPEKTKIKFKFGAGQRNSKIQSNNQFFLSLNAKHNFEINERNSINVKLESHYLQSNQYILNELHRFGGINSIRGFNENSLQATLLTSLQSEYRYRLSSNLYTHTILDYAFYEDSLSNLKTNLYGVGLGIGILTKNGLLKLVYANGIQKQQNFNLSNSIVHLSLLAYF